MYTHHESARTMHLETLTSYFLLRGAPPFACLTAKGDKAYHARALSANGEVSPYMRHRPGSSSLMPSYSTCCSLLRPHDPPGQFAL